MTGTRPDALEDRFAVVDIGSNSVRLVMFDGRVRSPAYFFNEKVYCGLGAGLEKTGRLDSESRRRTLDTLRRFAAIIARVHVAATEVVATAAMREADDGAEFAEEIRAETGLQVRIIDGEEEARLAALGVLMGEARAEGMVVDIGGASMELAQVRAQKVGHRVTTPLGPMRLMGSGIQGSRLTAHAAKTLDAAWPEPKGGQTLYLVGGGWRALASVDIVRRNHPLKVLQGYEIGPGDARATAREIVGADVDELREMGLSETRAANAPATAHVMLALLDHLRPSHLVVSACGLREGLLFGNLPDAVRKADPLTQSARIMEQLGARFPGFGDRLEPWLSPSVPEIPERLRVAAALLADVNWRMHPDYRGRACFATVTQSSLAGLTHRERVLLAVSLAFRYKNARAVIDAEPASALLDETEIRQAESLGRLIRLGAMIGAATPGILSDCPLERGRETLTLTIPERHRSLAGETVEKRLKSAAKALSLEPVLVRGGEEGNGGSIRNV